MKRFLEWLGVKEYLDSKSYKPPLISEGDIWWASIGENIGYEIQGKSKLFSRPVLIYKKISRNLYFVIPCTSKLKEGSWYVQFEHAGNSSIACLHQARAIDYRRLSSKLGVIEEPDFQRVRDAFCKLYGI